MHGQPIVSSDKDGHVLEKCISCSFSAQLESSDADLDRHGDVLIPAAVESGLVQKRR